MKKHNWSDDFKVVKEATCQETGYKAPYCTLCGVYNPYIDETIPISKHNLVNFTCTNCGIITDGNFEYKLQDDGTLKASKFIGDSDIVEIPSKLNGKTVTTLGENLFYDAKITELTIPSSITSYENNVSVHLSSFVVIYNLSSIKLNQDDYKLDPTNLGTTSIAIFTSKSQTYTIETIDKYYKVLKYGSEVVLLQYSGEESNPTIPSSITQIGGYAFADVAYLVRELTIPTTVKKAMYCAFSDMGRLEKITLHDNLVLSGYCFVSCSSLKEIILPENSTSLPHGLLMVDMSLVTVYIPKSVTTIGEYALSTCSPDSSKTCIYYAGSAADWAKITIVDGTLPDCCELYYYSATQPTAEGNYWHYVDGVITKW